MSSTISWIQKLPFGGRNLAEKGFNLYRSAPSGVLDGIVRGNFKAVVRYAAEKSAFYRRKFQAAGINPSRVNAPSDLGDFFTTPEDIRNNPHEFVCMRADTAYESTGTTSKRTKRVYFSRNEVREAGFAGAVGLWGIGVRPEDKIASAFDCSFWVSGPVLAASCEVIGCFHVEAGRIPPEEFYDRLSDYGLTVIVGDPSWVLRLSEIAATRGAWPLKLLIASGENFTEEARAYCEKVWGCPLILSYGQTEAFGAIGMESLAKEGYHLNEFHNHFEIINPDSEGYGELVYTNLNRRVMPLIRYRSGDITRFLTGPSKSGIPGKRVEKLKGRVDEWVPTAMGNIAPWMFESVFGRLPGVSEAWQVVVDKQGNKDRICFVAEVSDGSSSDLKGQFFKLLESEHPDAAKQHAMELFHWDFTPVPPGTLRQSRKLLRILDKRKFS